MSLSDNNIGQENLEHFKKVAESRGEDVKTIVAPELLDEQKKAEDEGGGSEQRPEDGGNAKPAENTHTHPENTLTDEAIIAELKKRNINIESLEDLTKPKPEDKPGDEQKSDAELKKHRIKEMAAKKNIPADIFDRYEKDLSKSPLDLVFDDYKDQRKSEINPMTDEAYTNEELLEEFELEYDLGLDDSDGVKKRKLRILDTLKDVIIKDRYKTLAEIESEFDAETNSASKSAETNLKIQEAKDALLKTGLSYNLKVLGGGKDEVLPISLPISKTVLDALTIDSNTADVSSAVMNKYVIDNLGSIIYEVAASYHSAMIEKKAAESVGIEARKREEFNNSGMVVSDEFKAKFKQAGISVPNSN